MVSRWEAVTSVREAFKKKNTFFVTNVKPPLTPPMPSPSCNKKHPLFLTRKTLSEELQKKSPGVSRSGLRPLPLKLFHPKIFSEKLKTVNPRGGFTFLRLP